MPLRDVAVPAMALRACWAGCRAARHAEDRVGVRSVPGYCDLDDVSRRTYAAPYPPAVVSSS
jgi:hypothetical protein